MTGHTGQRVARDAPAPARSYPAGSPRAAFYGLARAALGAVGRRLFDPRYLSGRHFDGSDQGWLWLWRGLVWQWGLGVNRHVPWPTAPSVTVSDPANIEHHPDDLNNFQSPGAYYASGLGRIVIGRGAFIGPGVGLITANHDPRDPDHHLPSQDIEIGAHCWIGMNAVILPGVVLGPYTSVGAGAVVTHSFPEGYCVVAGNPARILRRFQ